MQMNNEIQAMLDAVILSIVKAATEEAWKEKQSIVMKQFEEHGIDMDGAEKIVDLIKFTYLSASDSGARAVLNILKKSPESFFKLEQEH